MLLSLTATRAAAQMKVEVGGGVGWTISDGVSGQGVLSGDGNIYNEIAPKDSISYNLRLGLLEGNTEFGFLYGRQASKLEVAGTNKKDIGDMAVSTYHGYFGYNWFAPDAKLRPYVFFGLGATNYAAVKFVSALGVPRETSGETQFSTTMGFGVKAFPHSNFGFQGGMRWTPTYIKSDPGGYWCDPYWGCYTVGNAQYSNQIEFAGGVIARF
jgi:hypothetical protein